MNTKVVAGVSAAVAFVAGTVAGWFLRKRTEMQFVETTEEELQEYAAKFEKKEEDEGELSEDDYGEKPQPVPNVEFDKEGTNVNPAMDTRKVDYANRWKRDEIVHREGYGQPTPGDEEDLSVKEEDLDPDFVAEIQQEEPRFEHISAREFNDHDERQEVYFWYDRDNVVTMQDENEEEHEVPESSLKKMGFDLRKELQEAGDETEEIIGEGGFVLFMRDNKTDTVYSLVRYPTSYGKRTQQEEYGGTDLIERIHRRHGSIL